MGFNDYELIHTKRVNRERKNKSIYKQRLEAASGGIYSTYFGLLFGYMGALHGKIGLSHFMPTKELLTQPGLVKFLKGPGLYVAVPYIIGKSVGGSIFGDPEEVQNLYRNKSLYRTELRDYYNEMYHS